jgi:hypothetical protein
MIGTPKNIRSFLAKEYYHDLDIENCHPVLITQIAKKNKIDTPCINEYIDNRNKILNEITVSCNTTKDVVKNCFIRLLYGGSPKIWAEDNNIKNDSLPPILDEIQKEIGDIMVSILSNPVN